MFNLFGSGSKTFLLLLSFLITIIIISGLPSIYNLSPQGNLWPPITIFIPLSLITTLIYLTIISFLPGHLKRIKNTVLFSRTLFLTPFTLVTIYLYLFACPAIFIAPLFILASLLVHLFGIICVYLQASSEDQSRISLYRARKSPFSNFLFFLLNYFVSYVIILIIWAPLALYYCDILACC